MLWRDSNATLAERAHLSIYYLTAFQHLERIEPIVKEQAQKRAGNGQE